MAITLKVFCPPDALRLSLPRYRKGSSATLHHGRHSPMRQKGEIDRECRADRRCGAGARRARDALRVQNLPNMFGQNTNARLFGNARKRSENAYDPRHCRPPAALLKDGDVVLRRHHGMSPLAGNQLDSLLRNHGVTTIILSGVSLAFGVIAGTMDAVNRAYQVILRQMRWPDSGGVLPRGHEEYAVDARDNCADRRNPEGLAEVN